MTTEILIQSREDGQIYDISTLAGSVQVVTEISGQATKFTCTLQKDPNELFKPVNGSILSFRVDGEGEFWGYIFEWTTDADGSFKITAYDQLRYFKNEETIVTQNETASQIFQRLCIATGIERYRVDAASSYVPDAYYHEKKTLFSMIEYAIERSLIYEGKQYLVLDDFGTLVFTELSLLKTNLIIGNGSLATSYTYTKSIDSDTYNQVKIYRDDSDTALRTGYLVNDSDNIGKWGLLQYVEKADDEMNEAQIRERGEQLLKYYNRETETLKISAIAADGAEFLRAGNGLRLDLPEQGILTDTWIKRLTKTYNSDYCELDLEVYI